MNVDNSRPAYGTSGTYAVDASAPRAGNQVSTGTPAADTLSISGDVELAARAMAAAKASSDIRPEAVARGKAAVAKGVDVDALSDAMVSNLFESWRME